MNDQDAVRQFIEQVRWLYEPEFGDFKRKVNLYIQRLEETHPRLKSGPAEKVLAAMKSAVVYNPNGDMEATRRQVLKMANELLAGSSGGQVH